MLSYALSTASTYFHLPINEEEDKDINEYQRKYITWTADSSAPSSSSPSSTQSSHYLPSAERTQALNDVLANDDLYAILGVSKSDNLDKLALRRAYLARSRACHPECAANFQIIPTATCAFQRIGATYDSRPPFSKYDAFAAHPTGHAENTFRSIVMSMIRTLLKAINDINPSLSMGDEGINSVLNSLQRIRERALTCRTCIYALHAELTRLLELQYSLPIALEKAIAEQNTSRTADHNVDAILPRQVTLLIRGVDVVLEHMEGMLKK
ncbi:hypothetical protein B0H14DRAFT_2666001 [Mycena olivaceomarginata]|nr:hypothetical protein B0H14DRAFT_2666001 [Mycena olivaceomarginata]